MPSNNDISIQKAALRKLMQNELRSMDVEGVKAKSEAACLKMFEHPAYKLSKLIFCYRAMTHEADTEDIINKAISDGKRIAYPYIMGSSNMVALEPADSDAWETGVLGLKMPNPARSRLIAPGDFDLAIIPGLAFDANGGRLGRGAGYYDRFLKKTGAMRIGFCFSFQVVAQVPIEAHDTLMQSLVTDTICIKTI
ncbi:MAG: 5-formyltetrahydrofolate cyclo-ligase family protein [Firmicutes bacterium ADurb.Bin356]|nr:MAG: 5-formyltetrahydrofolate cyclo-ligase family protein [Firmicutes bacterium ADurb.Bin356]